MEELLRGNYKLTGLRKTERPEKEKQVSLEQEFEAAVFKKLGGSITFVKKSGSFIWKGKGDV